MTGDLLGAACVLEAKEEMFMVGGEVGERDIRPMGLGNMNSPA